jgi:hypothetical protein
MKSERQDDWVLRQGDKVMCLGGTLHGESYWQVMESSNPSAKTIGKRFWVGKVHNLSETNVEPKPIKPTEILLPGDTPEWDEWCFTHELSPQVAEDAIETYEMISGGAHFDGEDAPLNELEDKAKAEYIQFKEYRRLAFVATYQWGQFLSAIKKRLDTD